jgi:hypothetical protein
MRRTATGLVGLTLLLLLLPIMLVVEAARWRGARTVVDIAAGIVAIVGVLLGVLWLGESVWGRP